MELSRRGLFKAGGATLAAGAAFELTSNSPALAAASSTQEWKLVDTEERTNICCYCAGGCGVICSVRNGELVNLEGDPDHPVNKGGLCPKGATMFNLRNVVTPDRRGRKHNESRAPEAAGSPPRLRQVGRHLLGRRL